MSSITMRVSSRSPRLCCHDPCGPSDYPAAMRTTVALLFGGRSGEHGISCVTAGGILAAIDRDRYDVIAIGITREEIGRASCREREEHCVVEGCSTKKNR